MFVVALGKSAESRHETCSFEQAVGTSQSPL